MAYDLGGITCEKGGHYIMGGFEQPTGTSWIGIMGDVSNNDEYAVWAAIPKHEIDSVNGKPAKHAIFSSSSPVSAVKKSAVKALYSIYPTKESQDEFPSNYYKVFSIFCALYSNYEYCSDNLCVEGDVLQYEFSCIGGVPSYKVVGDDC